jgi:hypothetical protein
MKIIAESQVRHAFGDKMRGYVQQFMLEIEHLKGQFGSTRVEVVRKDQTIRKLLNIVCEQELYLNNIRKIVKEKQYK